MPIVIAVRNYELAHHKINTGEWSADPEHGLIYGQHGRPFRRRNTCGYTQIKYRDPHHRHVDRTVLAHRLLWEHTHGPITNGLTINHINGIKTDNRLTNLELMTVSQNVRHAYATGLMTARRGIDSPHTRITEAQVRDIYTRAWQGEDQAAIARDHNMSPSAVSNIKRGWTWAHVTQHEHRAA